jgi:S-DNA-T family DNA segregation ATPase FtsK/SpoIIIE
VRTKTVGQPTKVDSPWMLKKISLILSMEVRLIDSLARNSQTLASHRPEKPSNLNKVRRYFQKFKTDVFFLIYSGGALFLALSLWSYSPRDPSLSSLSWAKTIHNSCGIAGSFLADALLQTFGLSAILLPALFVLFSVQRIWNNKTKWSPLRGLWVLLLSAATAGLVSFYYGEARFFQGEIRSGGMIGIALHQVLIKAFNPAGGKIVLWVVFGLLLVFASEQTIEELIDFPRRFLLGSLKWLRKSQKLLFKAWGQLEFFQKTSASKEETKAKKEPVLDRFKLKDEKEMQIQEPKPWVEPKKVEDKKADDKKESPATAAVINLSTVSDNVVQAQPARRKVEKPKAAPTRVENWEMPKLSLLNELPPSRVRIDEKEIRKRAELLKEKMAHFNVRGDVVAAKPGPVVTMYEFKPEADVKLSKITELADDLALALSSESLRIIAPIPGRDVVGIETSNAQRETVYLKEMFGDEDFWKEDIKLPIALGKQANGNPRIVDMRKMPHLLVAGTTGSGKSVFTVSTIISLIFRHSPKTLRMILIDPKQVDLAAFENLPHLLMPVVTEARQAVLALKWAVREMEKRYKSMSKFGARGLEDYNTAVSKLDKEKQKEHEQINHDLENTPGKKSETYYFKPQPYLVVIVEEFADLMVTDKANVEMSVVKLAQKARACGIHLMICMQSPRKEVATGLIRTNFSSRIAFKVADAMESRIILDGTGAERLLAQGDMLFKGLGNSNLVRHHGPFLENSEIAEVVRHWADQGQPEYEQSIISALEGNSDSGSDSGGGEETEYDERYDEILSWASGQKEISASLIQRRFQLGYPRAARMIETFEREGVVGPANGSKPRQVLVTSYDSPRV